MHELLTMKKAQDVRKIYLEDLAKEEIHYSDIPFEAILGSYAVKGTGEQGNFMHDKVNLSMKQVRRHFAQNRYALHYAQEELESIYTDIEIVLGELIFNACKHGNKENGSIELYFYAKDDVFYVAIRDAGEGFDLDKIIDPTLDEHLLKDNGRGLFICSGLMDALYNQRNPSVVYVAKKIKNKEG